jgi:hypothetical protein
MDFKIEGTLKSIFNGWILLSGILTFVTVFYFDKHKEEKPQYNFLLVGVFAISTIMVLEFLE